MRYEERSMSTLLALIGLFCIFIMIPVYLAKIITPVAWLFWILVYAKLFARSYTWDPQVETPLWFGDVGVIHMLPWVIIVGIFGFIAGGVKGFRACIAVYGPLFLLPVFLIHIGMGTTEEEYTWRNTNYETSLNK